MTLHVGNFGGGVVLEGSADTEQTDELLACDSYDIGERGQLIVSSDLSGFADASSVLGPRLNPLYGMAIGGLTGQRLLYLLGSGDDGGGHPAALHHVSVDLTTLAQIKTVLANAVLGSGYLITHASFPFVDRLGRQLQPLIICVAPRNPNLPRSAYPLAIYTGTSPFGSLQMDYLGTGAGQFNEVTAGTKSKNLYPRGVGAYNNHLFLWGFDNKDATNGDGANRLMFSNVGNPLKIGNDPGPAGVDRDFLDTDAINIGSAGEEIRACVSWQGKYYIATNRELHWLAGYGRESFLTNGSVNIRKSRNVVGPHAMCEGPDGLLYGVSTEGLWGYDGASVSAVYRRLVDFRGKSLGWWDLIWFDGSRVANSYPGQTNQDLVWMVADPETMQVWIVIPWCNAASGYGYGTDTVIIKFHPQTGGFTRQAFIGKQLTHGMLLRREPTTLTRRFVLDSQVASQNIKTYAAKADASVSPILPVALPDVTFGEYAPFSPDEKGLQRRNYVTISWDSAASLPIVFLATPVIDGEAQATIKVSIQPTEPVAPADGDLWLDTSGTDSNIGNGVAGAIVPAAQDYVYKRWMTNWNKWIYVPEGGGELGTRVTFPIAYKGVPGDRHRMRLQTTALSGRYQIESLGLDPARDQK